MPTPSSRSSAPTLTVDRHGQLRLAGQHVFIVGADSPENKFSFPDNFAELDNLHNFGVNEITSTVFGGDDRTLHPFNDRQKPERGIDWSRVSRWEGYADRWYGKADDKIIRFLACEMEDDPTQDEATMRSLCEVIHKVAKGRPCVVDFEENKASDKLRRRLEVVREMMPYALRAAHNRRDGTPPWLYLARTGLVQMCSLQIEDWKIGEFADVAWADGQRSGDRWCVVASERAPYEAGFTPGDSAAFFRWSTASKALAGTRCYYGRQDQTKTDHAAYRDVYGGVSRPDWKFGVEHPLQIAWKAVGEGASLPNRELSTEGGIDLGGGYRLAAFETRLGLSGWPVGERTIRLKTSFVRGTAGNPDVGTLRLRHSERGSWDGSMKVQTVRGTNEIELQIDFRGGSELIAVDLYGKGPATVRIESVTVE